MFDRQELVDLNKDTEETRICVEIAGLSLVQTEPSRVTEVKINDETLEGKNQIKKLIKEGFRVKSIED